MTEGKTGTPPLPEGGTGAGWLSCVQSGGALCLVSVFTALEQAPGSLPHSSPSCACRVSVCLPFSGLVSVKRSSGGREVTARGCKFTFFFFVL